MRIHCVVGAVLVTASLVDARIDALASNRPDQTGSSAATTEAVQHEANLPNPYREIEDWEQMPTGRRVGAAAGIDIDRDGRSVWVFERCGGKGASKVVPATTDNCLGKDVGPLVKFDPSGKVVASIGAGLFNYPHGLTVDRDGNLWVTDGQGKDGKGQVVVELTPSGRVLRTLGHMGMKGAGPGMFDMPSDVAIGPHGDIYVADGHGSTNERIVKFSKEGKYLTSWGKKGSGPGEFSTPHSLAIDSKGRLFVADRDNNRIQVFDPDGRFLFEWTQFGGPSGIFIDRNDILYSVNSVGDQKGRPRGISVARSADGKAIAFIPDHDSNDEGYVGGREGIAADRDGNIYISRTGPGGLLKLVKKP